jgi:hypothetical protein
MKTPAKTSRRRLPNPRAITATRDGGAAADREEAGGNSRALVLGILVWIGTDRISFLRKWTLTLAWL